MPTGVPIFPSLEWSDDLDIRSLITEFYGEYVVKVWEEWSTFCKIPTWEVWWDKNWKVALHHMYHATVAFWKALVLTIEPLWILSSYFGKIFLKWLARHSVDKVTKTGKYLIEKQCSLSRTGLYIEAGIIVSAIGLYLLRRFIQRKRYVPRAVAWYHSQTRRCSLTLHRYQMKISKTSVVLAQLFPHLLFFGVILLFLLFTNLLQTLSSYPQFLSLLSLYHPLYQTLRSLHFTKNTSVVTVRSNLRRSLQYWVIYAVTVSSMEIYNHVPFLARTVSYVNRILPVTKASFVPTLQLVVILWLRYLPNASTTTGTVKKHFYQYSSPLDMIYYAIEPGLQSVLPTSTTSWMSYVLSKTQSGLEAAVWLRLISSDTKMTIMKILTECAAILPASITLMMPSYFTMYGIIYVSYLVPAAYSAKAIATRSNTKRRNQFWVLHYLVLVVLDQLQPYLRWVFFSTHLTLLLWASVQYESMIQYIYETILQTELEAFGLLPTDPSSKTQPIPMEETRTYRLLNSIIQKLPSNVQEATNDKLNNTAQEKDSNNKDNISNDTTNEKSAKEKIKETDNDGSKKSVKASSNRNTTPAKRRNSKGNDKEVEAETKSSKVAKLVQRLESKDSTDS